MALKVTKRLCLWTKTWDYVGMIVSDQNCQNIFWSITEEPDGLHEFWSYFEFLGQCTIRIDAYVIFQKGADNFEKWHKGAYCLVKGVVPP